MQPLGPWRDPVLASRRPSRACRVPGPPCPRAGRGARPSSTRGRRSLAPNGRPAMSVNDGRKLTPYRRRRQFQASATMSADTATTRRKPRRRTCSLAATNSRSCCWRAGTSHRAVPALPDVCERPHHEERTKDCDISMSVLPAERARRRESRKAARAHRSRRPGGGFVEATGWTEQAR
jgi:hypothetical protein